MTNTAPPQHYYDCSGNWISRTLKEARLIQDVSFSHEAQLHLQLSFNAHQALDVRADGVGAGPGEVQHRFNDIMRRR